MAEPPSGLLVLDKPAGPTSYDCVHRVKRILQMSRVGHCGTLDPRAEGILLVLVGAATRRQSELMELEKEYRFRAEFGLQTVTGDREGAIELTADYSAVTEARLCAVLEQFQGDQSQVPPRYAALKYQGKPYYEWARKGIDIPRAARPIHIGRLELLSFATPFWEARVVCSRGTYIRSLAEDVGRALQTVAVVDTLVRERVGPYQRKDGCTWETLNRLSPAELLQRLETPGAPAHA